MKQDTEDTKRLVQNLSQESENYFRQLHVWLGIGSAGGAVAIATLASHLPNPGYAFQYFSISFWFFLLGIISAGTAIFCLAMRASAKGQHYASAHNRDSINATLETMSQILYSSSREEKTTNSRRNELISLSSVEHARAESAWKQQRIWKYLWVSAMLCSASGFSGGFCWPLIQNDILKRPLIPTSLSDKAR